MRERVCVRVLRQTGELERNLNDNDGSGRYLTKHKGSSTLQEKENQGDYMTARFP